MKKYLSIIVFILIYSFVCLNAKAQTSEIKWDKWGVPHIEAGNEADVYYGFGWAQMRAHANLILKMYARSRGKSSEYWGRAENLQNDIISRKLSVPARANIWFEAQSAKMKRNINFFVAGMNDFCKKNPELINPENKIVLPVRKTDPLAQLQISYHLLVGAFTLQPQAAQWKSAGSNAWAIAPKKSENGNAMLMFQPHPPWTDEYLFFEAHLKSRQFNVYGISLLGIPTIAMGFNENLGWGMTFNQADAMDLIELNLRGNQYLIDGKWKKLEIREEKIAVKNGKTETVKVKHSDFGFIVEEKADKALALRLSGFDRPFLIKQFADMAKSADLKEFQTAVKQLQLPLQNIIYADKNGNIFYLYNGIIPKRPTGNFADWSGIISSAKEGALVKNYLSFDELPKMLNPKSGFIANSNNDPWTSTFPFELNPKDYLPFITDTPYKNFDFRSVKSIKSLQSKEKLSFADLVKMQSSTHSELADRVLTELIEFGEKSENGLLKNAAEVLKNWDRKTDSESKGVVLFANWYFAARKVKLFENDFSLENPLNTPNKLTDEAKNKLLDAAQQTIKNYGALDIAWGEVYQTNYAEKTLKGGLGLGEIGSFNAGFYRRGNDSKWNLAGGSAFTAVIEFGKKIRAKGILSYGNSTEKKSLFKTDQLQLMIDRKLREIFFYQNEIDKNLSLTEKLH